MTVDFILQEQILGISGSSSDDGDSTEDDDDASDEDNDKSDPDELYLEDDIVDEPEFKLPDDRAWGKKKHRYFGTDTTEEKIQWNLYNQDEELAQVEEETAKKLQERMAAELKDLVFDDLIPQFDDQNKSEHNQKKDLVEADISLLSKCKKLQLLKTESPEFLPVIEDLKSKCEELRCILSPLMDGIKLGKVPEGPIHHYITTKYRLVLNYVCNISMYMTIKCSSKSVRTHPVVGRLAQYRQLLQVSWRIASCY
ncbi:Something about silencing protein 10 [Halocaridina rubra]|uniref:Something about silencing protein 10 n=1 Tax=Halocaridina rubra TaxID=373956 RepID=A0AAN8XJN1_HALRR